ncbi:lysozyme inhibitor LprI family protein [Herbaspirillum sp. RV1423]|uniref:lysozyme inhibitor LprI family protein n=1 Tax=Herbaspirillum sp. RV1423 TaxID=1443993 RepID=UPI0004BC8405|nr:lysozyme inhibitor LprI family protein [Herbaspirillum sp. RV1423]
MNLFPWRIATLLSLSAFSLASYALDCNQAQTQNDMNECAAQALNKADAELNQTYVDYRNRLGKARQNEIRDVQLAWIKYRDLSCKYASSASVGGSAHSIALQSCLTEKTQERTRELKALSACPEGDISCPR